METKSLLRNVNWILASSIILLLLTLAMGSALLVSCEAQSARADSPPPIDHTKEAQIKRGKYLVLTSACNDCHTPKIMTANGPEPDTTRLLSGHPSYMPVAAVNKEAIKDWLLFNPHLTAAAGPWGVSFSANLTSDDTGIGSWTEEQFFTAIRKGKYKGLEGSRSLLPPMPWQVYSQMTDDDLRAIFAFLKSTRPVKNIVPAPIAPNDVKH
jgi:cytochrome c553